MIEAVVVFIISFLLGILIGYLMNSVSKLDGSIVLYENGSYLALSEKDAEVIQKSDIVNIRVNRKNFKGFNE